MTAEKTNPFWDFSIRVYRRAAVSKACLALQDRLKADVNLLLFCCWAGEHGHQLSDEQLEDCLTATDPWRSEILNPLRRLRKRLKMDLGIAAKARNGLRKKLGELELEAEHLAQDLLFDTLPLTPTAERGAEVAAVNLSGYMLAAGLDPVEEDLDLLAALLDGVFGAAPAESEELRLL